MQREVLMLGDACIECIVEKTMVNDDDVINYCLMGSYKDYRFDFKNGELVGWRNGTPAISSPTDVHFPRDVYAQFRERVKSHLATNGDMRREPLPTYLERMVTTATGILPN